MHDGRSLGIHDLRPRSTMRIARIKHADTISHAVVEGDRVKPIEGDLFGKWKPGKRTIPLDEITLLAPVAPANVICIGQNYLAHVKEGNAEPPKAPLIFLKPTTTINDPGAGVPLPAMAPNEVDYE